MSTEFPNGIKSNQQLVAEKGGSRTLLTRVSKLVMARDFWAQGFDSQPVTNATSFSLVSWNPRQSTAVLETFWRRRCLTGGKAASLQQPDDVFGPPSLPLSRNNFRRCVGAFDEDPLTVVLRV